MFLYHCLLLCLILTALFWDLKDAKIPNIWIVFGWLAGIGWQISKAGALGVFSFLAGAGLPIMLLFPLTILHMIGPGDVKIFSALGAITGRRVILFCICYSFVFGGILSLIILWKHGLWQERARYFLAYMKKFIYTRKICPYYVPGHQVENLHFTIAIFMGLLPHLFSLY